MSRGSRTRPSPGRLFLPSQRLRQPRQRTPSLRVRRSVQRRQIARTLPPFRQIRLHALHRNTILLSREVEATMKRPQPGSHVRTTPTRIHNRASRYRQTTADERRTCSFFLGFRYRRVDNRRLREKLRTTAATGVDFTDPAHDIDIRRREVEAETLRDVPR